MMQNSGLGNAVSPLTSLTWTFRLPQLLIVTWRGQPGVADEPQHALMGPITPAHARDDADPLGAVSDRRRGDRSGAGSRRWRTWTSSGRPYALLMQKGSVAPYARSSKRARRCTARDADRIAPRSSRARSRRERGLAAGGVARGGRAYAAGVDGACWPRPDSAAASCTPSTTARISSTWWARWAAWCRWPRPGAGAPGSARDGAGRRWRGVDAHGRLRDVGAYGPPNLMHLLLDNGAHDSTGGQATVSPRISFAGVAAACGYARRSRPTIWRASAAWLDAPRVDGPRFARLLIRSRHAGAICRGRRSRPSRSRRA